MRFYLILFLLSGQLIIQLGWCAFLRRNAAELWRALAYRKMSFLLILTVSFFDLILNGAENLPLLLQNSGMLAMKFSFMLSAAGAMFFYFHIPLPSIQALLKQSRLLDAATSVFLMGFSVCITHSLLRVSFFLVALFLLVLSLFYYPFKS